MALVRRTNESTGTRRRHGFATWLIVSFVSVSTVVLFIACRAGEDTVTATVPSTHSNLPESGTAAVAESTASSSIESEPGDQFGGEWDDEEIALVWQWLTQEDWPTDFRWRTVNLTEIETLNFRDRILPVDAPEFAPVSNPPAYMQPGEPVVSLVIDGHARAYPLAMLMWHEIVNDTVGGTPVVVTYCPLCNTAIVFDRTVNGRELTFGTTGSVRKADLVMWDRQTDSWWQQITGEAIVGEFVRRHATLDHIPAAIVSWERFATDHPEGEVLIRMFKDNGEPVRAYDTAPYTGYDNSDRNPFAYFGEVDRRLVVTSRVLALNEPATPVAYPFEFLAENPVVNDVVSGVPVVAFYDGSTLSSFNDWQGEKQAAGSANAFSRKVDDQVLTFRFDAGGPVDRETGTRWSLSGIGLEGELAGERLTPVLHGNHFWFAWALFWPETEIRDSLDELVATP